MVPPLVALSERERGTRQAVRAVQRGPKMLNRMATIREPAGVLNPQVVPAEGNASGHSGALQD